MKRKLLLSFLLFVLVFLASCGDDVVFMPASLCQVTCTDDATGDTYGIALRAIAWNDESGSPDKHDGADFGCNVYVDAYRGEMDEYGEFITAPVSVELDSEDSYDEAYTLDFFDLEGEGLSSDDLPSLLDDPITLYQLLDESTISISQSDTALAAVYEHRINPCVMNAQLELNVYCDTSEEGDLKEYVKIICNPNDADTIAEANEDENDIQCEDNIHVTRDDPTGACIEDDYEINEDDIESLHPSIQAALDSLEEELS